MPGFPVGVWSPEGCPPRYAPPPPSVVLSTVSVRFLIAICGFSSGEVAFARKELHDCLRMAEPYERPISDQPLPERPRLRAGLSIIPRAGETMVFSPRLESMEA